ncbi:hypothetical protein, partial [Geobacillus sp. YHL]|uniref:hypothetical protein n=1 Tax=Geobacillus sp. YHL TaxID=2796117 RepID=UPI001EF007AB
FSSNKQKFRGSHEDSISAPVFPAGRLLALGHPAEAWGSPALDRAKQDQEAEQSTAAEENQILP